MWLFYTLVDKEGIEEDTENIEKEFTYQGFGDNLSDVIYVGDNLSINVEEGNPKGVDFYLLKCTVCKQCATHNIVDAWGNVVSAGTFYIEGIFYARVDKYDYVYKF